MREEVICLGKVGKARTFVGLGDGLEKLLSKVEGPTKVQAHEFIVTSVHMRVCVVCVCVRALAALRSIKNTRV